MVIVGINTKRSDLYAYHQRFFRYITKERFANGRVCPICGCIHVVRNGHRKDDTQRYICKDCGKSFVIATNSIVSGTRKDFSAWVKYIDCMMNGRSIRKTAMICGIHRNTAFFGDTRY